MRQWILLAIILSAGTAAAYTVTMNFAVRVGDNTTSTTLRVNDTNYYYSFLQALVPANDIMALLHFDNSTLDSGFYGNNGTAIGGVDCAPGVTGKISGACNFDGVDDYVEINRSGTIEPQNFTLAAWVYLKDKVIYQVIFDKPFTSHVAPFYTYNFRFRNISSTAVRMELYVVNDTFDNNDTVIIDLNPSNVYNKWVHIAGTYDQNYISLYFNGDLVRRQYNKGALTYHDTNLSIGRFRNLGSGYVNGSIDEAALWSRALSETEIYALYASSKHFNTLDKKYISVNRTNTLAGIVSAGDFSSALIDAGYARYIVNSSNLIVLHLDNSTLDSSASGNNGMKQGNVDCALNSGGKINSGCSFSGGHINFSKLDIEGAKNYTIAMWIKTSSASGGLFTQSDGTSNHLISVLLSGGAVNFNTFESGAGNIADSTFVSDNNWHHVAVTKMGTAGKIYVDGIPKASGVVASPSLTNDSRIGSGVAGASAFSGGIDEFIVFNYPLGDGDIYELYRHDPHYVLTQISQESDGHRILLAATNATYTDIENKLAMIDATKTISSTFGTFAKLAPSSFPLFIRLEYKDVDIENRQEWSGIGRLLIKNMGFNSHGIPIVRLELVR